MYILYSIWFGQSREKTSRTSINHSITLSKTHLTHLFTISTTKTRIHTVQYYQARLWPFQRFAFFLLEPFHYTFCGTLVDLLYNFLYSIYCTYAQMIPWREYLIIYRGSDFLASCLSFSVFLFVEGRAYWREREDGAGVEPNHTTARKPDPLNHSILSGTYEPFHFYPSQQASRP
jgi:hypothetical protein